VDRRSARADRIGAARDADLDLPERDLVADVDGRFQARATGALQVEPRGVRIETTGEYALADQVVVARVLDDRARRHIAEPLAL